MPAECALIVVQNTGQSYHQVFVRSHDLIRKVCNFSGSCSRARTHKSRLVGNWWLMSAWPRFADSSRTSGRAENMPPAEVAPIHSITRLAIASRVGGISIPRAFAERLS